MPSIFQPAHRRQMAEFFVRSHPGVTIKHIWIGARHRRRSINGYGDPAQLPSDIREPMDMGFLYNRCVQDPDGHVLEFIWMDIGGASDQQPA